MKIISNFTQTYRGSPEWTPGSDCKNRDFLIEAFCNDHNKIKCYKLLDKPTFSYHNFDTKDALVLNDKIKTVIPNIKSYCYSDTSFGYCILTHLNMLKSQGVTDFIWLQDDEFFTHSSFEDFANFYNFYKNEPDLKNVTLVRSHKEFLAVNAFNVKTIPNTNMEIHRCHAQDLANLNLYAAMDFTAFICNIDYFLTKMFDSSFVRLTQAYDLERAVTYKSIKNNIERGFLNINFFSSFNIVGMGGSLCQTGERLKELTERFLS